MKSIYKLIFLISVSLIISWLFIYYYDYMRIPISRLHTVFYYLCVSLVYLVSIGIILLCIYYKSHKPDANKKIILSLLLVILSFNTIMLVYNRYEVIYYKECYIVRKEVRNAHYYLITDNYWMLKCSLNIYNEVDPNKEYLLTYRGNKLRFYRDTLVDVEELE